MLPELSRGSRARPHECTLLDQHVDDAQRWQEIGGAAFAGFQPVDRMSERQRPREQRKGRESPRAHVDDRPVWCIDQDVTRRIESRADAGRELQQRLRGEV